MTQAKAFNIPGAVMFVKPVVTAEIPVDSAAYQEIINSGTTVPLLGTTALGITPGAFDIAITIDGVAACTSVTVAAATVTGVINAINTAIGAAGTAALVGGRIRVTSATTGHLSSVAIVDGGGAGDPLLATINAVPANALTIQLATGTAVAGVEGGFNIQVVDVPPTDLDFIFDCQVRSSAGLEKTGFYFTFSKTTGLFTVTDNTASLANGDVVTLVGDFGVI